MPLEAPVTSAVFPERVFIIAILEPLQAWVRGSDVLRDLHRLDQIRCRGTLERQTLAEFPHDAFLQRLSEMHASVTARHLWDLEVQVRELTCTREGFTVAYDLGDHAPFVCSSRGKRPRMKQERLGPARPGSVTPRGEYSVTGHNAAGE